MPLVAAPEETRTCTKCEVTKEIEAFPYQRAGNGKHYRLRYCKECRNAQRIRARRIKAGQPNYTDELAELAAGIPVPVIRPYLMQMLQEIQRFVDVENGGKYPGIGVLAERLSVDVRWLRRVLEGEQRGIDLDLADRIAIDADFTLNELTERAREWAFLTGDSWPRGYRSHEG